MEIWQLASVLGLARPPEKGKAPHGNGTRDLTAERIAAASGRAPRPEARPVDPDTMAAMRGQVN